MQQAQTGEGAEMEAEMEVESGAETGVGVEIEAESGAEMGEGVEMEAESGVDTGEGVEMEAESGADKGVASEAELLVTGGGDSLLRVWRRREEGRMELQGHFGLCSESWEEPAPVAVLRGHTGGVTCLCFSPGGGQLLSGAKDQALLVWQVKAPPPCLSHSLLHCHGDWITGCAWTPFGLVSCSTDGRVRMWESQTGGCVREISTPLCFTSLCCTVNHHSTLSAHSGGIRGLATRQEGVPAFLSVSEDCSLMSWSVALAMGPRSMLVLQCPRACWSCSAPEHAGPAEPQSMLVLQGPRACWSCSAPEHAGPAVPQSMLVLQSPRACWSCRAPEHAGPAGPQSMLVLQCPRACWSCSAPEHAGPVVPQSMLVLSCPRACWSCSAPEHAETPPSLWGGATALSFSRCGQLLMSGHACGRVQVWSHTSVVCSKKVSEGAVTAVTSMPDSQFAVGCSDSTVTVWRVTWDPQRPPATWTSRVRVLGMKPNDDISTWMFGEQDGNIHLAFAFGMGSSSPLNCAFGCTELCKEQENESTAGKQRRVPVSAITADQEFVVCGDTKGNIWFNQPPNVCSWSTKKPLGVFVCRGPVLSVELNPQCPSELAVAQWFNPVARCRSKRCLHVLMKSN
ncbi:hypothetical protein JZ751_003367 [Albula glossodonta]|uniref:TEP-1 second beta-propeller domain-containing protein n=1 Tax=Albula glossodonta TaxID=121402 RepID=A0A8T2MW10_9TELE|nr:hypothetical protein JZ751_003367 [Albula glossodonta]